MVFGKDQNQYQHPEKYTPEAMKAKIDEYFNWCDNKIETIYTERGGMKTVQEPYTISGMCEYLEISKETLRKYYTKPDYADMLRNAKGKVERYCETNTMKGKLNPIFSIFSLKNNFGWTDKLEVNTNTQPETLTAADIRRIRRQKDDGENE